jgi:hypothetical protein
MLVWTHTSLVRLVVLCGLAAGLARAQFSPGPLSKAHSSLDGPAHCTACHALGAGTRKFKCLGCHIEIRQRLAERRGLHATLVKQISDQSACVRCHSEHNGEIFVPIRWDVDVNEFDHRQAGYSLEGGHKGLACKRCHSPEHIPASERAKIRIKDMRRTYLGLSPACLTCHADEHRAQLSSDCQRCHGFVKWRPAASFDHAKARYQLTGAHERVACNKCHVREEGPKPFIKYTGIQFSSCAPCHSDPHRGAFAAPCQSCHNDLAWKQVRTAEVFDHSRTKFPLDGKHAAVACDKCHRSTNYKEAVAHDRCVACHVKDPHQGQFASRTGGIECGACHTVVGWKPSTFVAVRHTETHYPLAGRHAALACAKCHIPKGADTVYKVKFERCTDCHQDIHREQFARAPYFNHCEECHTVGGFRPSTFTLARHQKTDYPLHGAHTAVPCAECHNESGARHTAAGLFRHGDRACTGCHQDPHQGQFRERMATVRAGGASTGRAPADDAPAGGAWTGGGRESGISTGRTPAGGARAGCESCHTMRSWRDLSRFDHAMTSFALTGTHRGVACAECHRPAKPGLGIKSVVYKSAPQACVGCHEDIHGGQFTGLAASGGCGRCHGASKWRPATFVHDRDSTFKLAGAHSEVQCGLCHKTRQELKGKMVLVYKAAPRECSSCHGPNLAKN